MISICMQYTHKISVNSYYLISFDIKPSILPIVVVLSDISSVSDIFGFLSNTYNVKHRVY